MYYLRGKQKFVDIEDYIAIENPFVEAIEDEVELPDDKQIRNAIISLGEPCKSLLIGYYYEGLNMEQLAVKLMYKSANVVKQQKFRCKDRLKLAVTKFLK